MDLFSLVAKLTLDTNEFDREIDKAESDLKGIDVSDPKLELDNDDFNAGIEESQGLGDTFGSEMEKVFAGIKKALTVTGIVGLVLKIVDGLKEAVNLTAQTADGIDKGSKRLGISRKAYQEWDHALQQSGSGIEDVKKGIMQMQLAIQAANPATMFADAEDSVDGLADKTVGLSQDAYEAMRELGLLDRLTSGEFQNAEQLMEASLLALAGFEGSTDDRGILVRKLFGRGGDNLNALLDEGEDGVKALLKEAGKLGLVMTDQEIDNAVAYGDAVANLQKELDSIKMAFVESIIPALTSAVTWLTDFLTKLNPRLKTNSIYDIIDEINKRTIAAGIQVDEATAEAVDLIDQLIKLGNYWELDEEGKMTWDKLAERALELFPQLSDYIDRDGKKIQGNTKDIINNIKAWGLLEKQRLLTASMQEKEEAVADHLTKAYEKGAEARAKMSEAEGKRGTAIKALNETLKKEGFDELGMDATYEDFLAARSSLYNKYNVGGTGSYGSMKAAQFLEIGSEYDTLMKEAQGLRTEADGMKEDANRMKSELAENQRYLMEEMGFTEEEILQITNDLDDYIKKLDEVPSDVTTTFHTVYDDGEAHPRAIGGTIPYDNYPALLHRGEKVLTATQVRRGEGASGIDYGHLEDRIATAIRNGMDGATVRSYLNGRDITDEVNRNNMNGVKGRRFAG